MSSRHKLLETDIELSCPNYKNYDKRARKDSKERINDHLEGRRDGIKRCVDTAVEDAYKLQIKIRDDAPEFIDDNHIISHASDQINIQINNWDGVQIKQCKTYIDSFEQFAKKAKNHQDQTSWKISGDFFFAPYIKKAKNFLSHFTRFIMDIDEPTRVEIQRLLYLSYAAALLNGEIKFKRTKLKPLIRHRTLVKSKGIHRELAALDALLTVPKFIQNARQERKRREGKSNIIAATLFEDFKCFVNKEYWRQKRKVYGLLNKPFDDDDEVDSIVNDMDDDDDEMEEDDTPSMTHYKRPTFAPKTRAFQSIVRRNVVDKEYIMHQKRKALRTARVDQFCESFPHVTHTNGVNMETASVNEGSDCATTNNSLCFGDDRSLSQPVPPPRPPPPPQQQQQQRYRPFRYYPASGGSQRMVVQMIRRENQLLRDEVRRLGCILRDRQRRVYPPAMPYYPHARKPMMTVPKQPPVPPVYDTQRMNDIPPAIDTPSPMTSDDNCNTSSPIVFEDTASSLMGMDPYNESMQLIPDPTTLSPDPFTNNNHFELDSAFFS